MKLYDAEQTDSSRLKACCTLEDAEDARSVAYRLGMQYYVFNFKEDFREQVIGRFVDAYERGETPNPCIDCNRYMKFEKLYQRARVLGYDTIVTGHYARIAYDETSGRWLLKKGRNAAKDQSYVLYAMTQEELAHTQFPLGEFESKDEVRKLAASYGFINAEKHDSQDICFVPDGDYAAFIERYTGKQYPHGDFIDESGRVLGEHQGLIRYTIGQRRGLGIAAGKPVYVCRKSVADNTVTLSDSASLFSTRLTARDFNWIAFAQPPEHPIRVAAKPRYRAKKRRQRQRRIRTAPSPSPSISPSVPLPPDRQSSCMMGTPSSAAERFANEPVRKTGFFKRDGCTGLVRSSCFLWERFL